MADGSDMRLEPSSIVPGPETGRAFRDALGRFATGVTVVTARTPDGPIGMTVNSFASLSLDPPLVMWCAAKKSERYASFVEADSYVVHVMAAGQCDLALAFARSAQAFEGLDMEPGESGAPLIQDCLARFECSTTQRLDGGDHTILVGRVTRATVVEGDGLVFSGGRYGRFVDGAV